MPKINIKQLYWKLIYRIRYFFGDFFRKKKITKMRELLKNRNFTIIASNCCGAILTHDLGIRFNTPTVNCFFEADDFVKFCENLPYYLSLDPVFLYWHEQYPVCGVGDVKIFAMHYKTAREFIDAWNRRRKRVNFDELFIMMTDRDGFHEALLERLHKIPYKKVLFTHKKHERYPFVCYVKQFKNADCVGDMFKYADIFGNRYYEKAIDVVRWLNNEETIIQ